MLVFELNMLLQLGLLRQLLLEKAQIVRNAQVFNECDESLSNVNLRIGLSKIVLLVRR